MIIFYAIFMFIIGALMTSFYHVVATRIPKHETIMGRSHCESCNHQLRWIDVIPILGYLMNRSRCHYCQSKIPICHLLLEILGGLLFMMTFLIFGFTLELAITLIMISVFLIESISDIKYNVVIDRVWIIGLIPLVLIRIIEKSFFTFLLSAVILFTLLFLIAFIAHKITKKDALGGGDVKIYIFVGFLVTYQLGILTLFLASLFGFIYGMIKLRNKQNGIPLVPFIFIATLIVYFYGQDFLNWYFSLLGM
ncbi:MAG: prepilin peptidase [Tenericutes bacterium]|nr:prepilin peptidase [Mycoplasmatota bacterium]